MLGLGLGLSGCLAVPSPSRPHDHPAPSAQLDRALHEADAHPDDWRAQQRAGSALTQQVLQGDRSRFAEAVDRLERARQLHPQSRQIPRMLGRLLNLPLSEGDLRWANHQRDVYAHLVRSDRLADAPEPEQLVDHCFLGAAEAAVAVHRHDPIGAAVRLRRLEDRMERRLADDDDDVDLHAMLGNYAQQIAGLTRVGRGRRIQLALHHLEPVVQRWDALSPEAQGLGDGVPGVRTVFTYWLAELSLADGRVERAHALYEQVEALAQGAEATPAMHVLAQAGRARRALPQVPPREALVPVWPAGYDSCIACHAHEAVPHPPRPARRSTRSGAVARR